MRFLDDIESDEELSDDNGDDFNYDVSEAEQGRMEIVLACCKMNRKDSAFLKKVVRCTLNLVLTLRTHDFVEAHATLTKLNALKERPDIVHEEAFVFGYLVPLLYVYRAVENFACNKKLRKKWARNQSPAFWKFRKKFCEVPFWDELLQLSNTRSSTAEALRKFVRHDLCVEVILEYHDNANLGCTNLQFIYQSIQLDAFIRGEISFVKSAPPNLEEGHGEPHPADEITTALSQEEFRRRGFV